MEGSTPNADERFAEWFVWAKREVGSDIRVCLGAAQAALEAQDAGADDVAARAAGRRSTAGHGIALVGRIDPRRRAYAEWYDWARREVGGDRERMHAAVRLAMERLDQGADPADAAAAARGSAGTPAPPPPPPVPAPPPPVVQAGAPQQWAPQAPVQQGSYQPPSYASVAYAPQVPVAPAPYAVPVSAPVAPTHAYAGFARRLGAYVIDAVLVTVVLVVVFFVLSIFALIGLLSSGQDLTNQNLSTGVTLALYLIALVLAWLYFAGTESSAWQATIGKRLLRLVVTDLHGQRLSFWRATGRYFAKLPMGFLAAVVFIVVAVTLLLVLGLAGNPTGGAGLLVLLLALLLAGAVAAGVTALFIQGTRRRQALQDLMAGTLVVRREYLPEVAAPAQEARPASHPGGGPREVQGA